MNIIEPPNSCVFVFESLALGMRSNRRKHPTEHSEYFLTLFKNDPYFSFWISGKPFLSPEEAVALFGRDRAAIVGKLKPSTVKLYGTEVSSGMEPKDLEALKYIYGKRVPSIYEARVALLRKGDTVQFSDGQYELGEYLGRGSNTHVYTLANDFSKVIRIPFKSEEEFVTVTNFPPNGPRLQRKNIRASVQTYVEASKKFKGLRVEIDKIGRNFEYVITSRVNGTMNGANFFDGLKKKYSLPNESLEKTLQKLSPEDALKLSNLMKSLTSNGQDPSPYGGGIPRIYSMQYLLDESTQNWILVDFE